MNAEGKDKEKIQQNYWEALFSVQMNQYGSSSAPVIQTLSSALPWKEP